MHKLLKPLYKKIIHPLDPAFFVTRYAAKSVLACLLALLLAFFLQLPQGLYSWCIFGAFILMLSRAGSTYRERRLVAIKLILITAILVPVSTWAGGLPLLREAYVFILVFCAFFSACLGFPNMVIAMGVMIINLLAIGSPEPLLQGVFRTMAVLLGGGAAYGVSFHIWPVHPETVLRKAGVVALTDLADFFRVVTKKIQGRSLKRKVFRLQDRTTTSLRRYRQIMEAMNLDPMKELENNQGPTALYGMLIRLKTAIVGLDRNSRIHENRLLSGEVKTAFSNLAAQASIAFDKLVNLLEGTSKNRPQSLENALDHLENQLLKLGAYKRGDDMKEEFLEAWGAIHALRHLNLEMENMARLKPLEQTP
ncbi:aromatic acid exporter family protein [Desulfobacula toluolica]|uniref:Conserved uncharacterized protein n=1 Tax=Desulfobacula toluolica (strain DSM 7467 / Tol2) TaxID=651182 RepID=K0NK63_DESTT|nr:hypothetical protein [Desulfobacula toluolica]CCK81926.1 conserved uncharacterized protein [Desulfobacula toluolica Tol2]